MEKKSKKTIIIGLTCLLLVTLILVGLTYAYYRTRIKENPYSESMSTVFKSLKIEYVDGTASANMEGLIEPGYIYTKTFSVKNTGSQEVSYGVKLDNILSTVKRKEDWVFTLKKGEEIIKNEEILPSNESYIYNNVSIGKGETDTYTLTITYKNLPDVNQSIDMGSQLSLRVNIDEPIGDIFTTAGEGTLLASIGNDNLIQNLTFAGDITLKNYHVVQDSASYTLDHLYMDTKYTCANTYEFDINTGKFTLLNAEHIGNEASISLTGKYLAKLPDSINEEKAPTENLTTIYKVLYEESDSARHTLIIAAPLTASLLETYSSAPGKETSRTDEAMLTSTDDDYGTSYYFRGKVDNNFVNYSGMCWRIVRVLGNGNIKLALADENNECNSSNYSLSNTRSGLVNGVNNDRVSYKNTNNESDVLFANSNIPGRLKTWSERTNKSLDTSELVTEAEWCNDTSIGKQSGNDKYYGANTRLLKLSSANPSLKCAEGGTKYIGAMGLLSADEVVFAGSTYWEDNLTWNNYLMENATGVLQWTISPSGYINSSSTMFYIGGDGFIYPVSLNNIGFVRPVIVLKSTALATTKADTNIYGERGTYTNPYVVQ